MKVFLTGATGFIGERLSAKLIEDGHGVHALIRSRAKAARLLEASVKVFEGDLHDTSTIEEAMQGCDAAFHLAAYARVWSKDRNLPYRINVEGTENVFEAAKKAGVKRVVFTSTGGTLEPSDNGNPTDENTPRKTGYFNAYEVTKAAAEELAVEYNSGALEVITVNPTRVYGPGQVSASAAMTKIISKYNRGKWHIIPGDGKNFGNYVFIDNVVNGHLLALAKGKPGERYILGGENATYDQFFETLEKVTGRKAWMVHIRYPLLRAVTWVQFAGMRLAGKPPLITPEWIKKYLHHWACSSKKAQQDLGYQITPLDEGIKKTLEWIKNNPEK